MADGFTVDADQIRRHAAHIDAIQQQFGAIRSASAAIARDDQAFGLLCAWMAGILEGRHARQDQLYAKAEENLRIAADALAGVGQGYDATDEAAAERIHRAGGGNG